MSDKRVSEMTDDEIRAMAGVKPERWSFTRDELIDALSRLEARVPTSGPLAGKILAESMADAIIEALTGKRAPVHYHWPAVCGGESPGDLWTGNLDRVTCYPCRYEGSE